MNDGRIRTHVHEVDVWPKVVKSLRLQVECYAGYKADERPLRFTPNGPSAHTYQVKEILDRWYGLGYQCFKVRADDGNIYVLRHDEAEDRWTLDSFRRDSQATR